MLYDTSNINNVLLLEGPPIGVHATYGRIACLKPFFGLIQARIATAAYMLVVARLDLHA
jgi:hypothetical protein